MNINVSRISDRIDFENNTKFKLDQVAIIFQTDLSGLKDVDKYHTSLVTY